MTKRDIRVVGRSVLVKGRSPDTLDLEEFCRLFKKRDEARPLSSNSFKCQFETFYVDGTETPRRGRRSSNISYIRILPKAGGDEWSLRTLQAIAAKLVEYYNKKSSNPEEGNAGKEDKKDTDLVDGSTKSGDASHGGDNASNEVPDSPNAAKNGDQEQNSDQDGEDGDTNKLLNPSGQGGENGSGEGQGGESNSDNDSRSESNGQPTQGSGSCSSSPENMDVKGGQKSECSAGDTQYQGNKVASGNKTGGITATEALKKIEDSVKAALNAKEADRDGSDEEFVEAVRKTAGELVKKLSPELLSDLADKIADVVGWIIEKIWSVDAASAKIKEELLEVLKSAKSDHEFDAVFDETAARKLEEINKLLAADPDLSSWRKDFNRSGGGDSEEEWLREILNAAAPDKKTLRAMKRVFDKILKSLGGDTEVSPRLDKKLLIRKLAEYKSPYSARKMELGDGRILITVDTSLSMTGFYHFAKFALDLAKKDPRVVVVINSNMDPWYLYADGKEEWIGGFDPNNYYSNIVDYYSKLVDKYNIEKAIVINDLDGVEVIEELYPRLARKKIDIIHIDNYACNYGLPTTGKLNKVLGDNSLRYVEVEKINFYKYCTYWWGVADDEDILYVLRKTWKVK